MALLRPSDGEGRAVDRVDRDVARGTAGADLLAVEQHRRFVLLALADDDDAVHRDGVEDEAHGVDGGTVGAVLVALPDPTSGGQRGGLGDPHELHREVAIGGLGLRFHPGERTLRGMDERLLDAARAAVGFMPDDEGLALARGRAATAAARGPLLEIGTYCGKSAVYLGAAAREGGTVLFTVDHHRGSEENQAGWEHHDTDVVDPRTGRMDTLPFFRRTIEDAGLEDVVVAVIGRLADGRPRTGPRRSGCCSSTAATRTTSRSPTTRAGPATSRPAALLVFHDVFEDPADGGQAPFDVWQRAVADGFTPVSTTGSLRVLRAPTDRTVRRTAVVSHARRLSMRESRCLRARSLGFDLDAGREQLLGGEARGQALAAEQARGRARAAERVRREHDRGGVPRRAARRGSARRRGRTASSSKFMPVQ